MKQSARCITSRAAGVRRVSTGGVPPRGLARVARAPPSQSAAAARRPMRPGVTDGRHLLRTAARALASQSGPDGGRSPPRPVPTERPPPPPAQLPVAPVRAMSGKPHNPDAITKKVFFDVNSESLHPRALPPPSRLAAARRSPAPFKPGPHRFSPSGPSHHPARPSRPNPATRRPPHYPKPPPHPRPPTPPAPGSRPRQGRPRRHRPLRRGRPQNRRKLPGALHRWGARLAGSRGTPWALFERWAFETKPCLCPAGRPKRRGRAAAGAVARPPLRGTGGGPASGGHPRRRAPSCGAAAPLGAFLCLALCLLFALLGCGCEPKGRGPRQPGDSR